MSLICRFYKSEICQKLGLIVLSNVTISLRKLKNLVDAENMEKKIRSKELCRMCRAIVISELAIIGGIECQTCYYLISWGLSGLNSERNMSGFWKSGTWKII